LFNICNCNSGLVYKSKNYYITAQNRMYFTRETSQKLRQKRKWALWLRHLVLMRANYQCKRKINLDQSPHLDPFNVCTTYSEVCWSIGVSALISLIIYIKWKGGNIHSQFGHLIHLCVWHWHVCGGTFWTWWRSHRTRTGAQNFFQSQLHLKW
jgi:hypothetical protein